ncbi:MULTISPECIES: HlyD family secretion protein [Frigidibacter]|uniref:Secretion protein HlyD family protein n=1 Tax=Frigidibacter mobilis TaxID=1335048 RepID=A0A159Z3R8_9RHOB|nr:MULTISPECIES: HlyD family efflux transporter periplasmic adaptor subunit [Frigidibacter]AMY69782.1 secretion protein HlyD family protein [Frigidibacter mobilis]MDP3340438.1 HlyD family efflux transporter periplasmic adaptor subunit [Frigidibacter sp.]
MTNTRPILMAAIVIAGAVFGYFFWQSNRADVVAEGFARGNGRIEAVEIDVASKLPGRIEAILVREGGLVEAGQPLVTLDTRQLKANRHQAEAELRRTEIAVKNARLMIRQRQAEVRAAEAGLAQRQSALDAAQRQFARSEALAGSSVASERQLDIDRSNALGAEAAVASAEAMLAAARIGVSAAEAAVIGAEAAVAAATAAIEVIDVQIEDSTLNAPRAGRIQYIIAREGEVVGAGGRVVNMVDLNDVYMTFFLPTAAAGQIGLGTEVRLLLDAAPGIVIPAHVSFVSSVAQFTPRTVETEIEREKLMFRVRATIAPDLLGRYLEQIKTGLPGVAWVRLDPASPWPAAAQGQVLE